MTSNQTTSNQDWEAFNVNTLGAPALKTTNMTKSASTRFHRVDENKVIQVNTSNKPASAMNTPVRAAAPRTPRAVATAPSQQATPERKKRGRTEQLTSGIKSAVTNSPRKIMKGKRHAADAIKSAVKPTPNVIQAVVKPVPGEKVLFGLYYWKVGDEECKQMDAFFTRNNLSPPERRDFVKNCMKIDEALALCRTVKTVCSVNGTRILVTDMDKKPSDELLRRMTTTSGGMFVRAPLIIMKDTMLVGYSADVLTQGLFFGNTIPMKGSKEAKHLAHSTAEYNVNTFSRSTGKKRDGSSIDFTTCSANKLVEKEAKRIKFNNNKAGTVREKRV